MEFSTVTNFSNVNQTLSHTYLITNNFSLLLMFENIFVKLYTIYCNCLIKLFGMVFLI